MGWRTAARLAGAWLVVLAACGSPPPTRTLPPAQPAPACAAPRGDAVASIAGYDVSRAEAVALAWTLDPGGENPAVMRRGLLEREAFLREAEARGIALPDPPPWEAGVMVGHRIGHNGRVPPPMWVTMREGVEGVRRMGEDLDVPWETLIRWQRREALALLARERIAEEVDVDEAEVRATLVQRGTAMRIHQFHFRAAEMAPPAIDRAEVQRWMLAHAPELAAELEREADRFVDRPAMRRARHLLVAAPEGSPATERRAAQRRARGLLRRARGGASLAELAVAHSDDAATAQRGGDLGWLVEADGLDAAFEPPDVGLVRRVIESPLGYHLIEVTGIRPVGDVPAEDAAFELAEPHARRALGAERAREEAEAALARWRGGDPPNADGQRVRSGVVDVQVGGDLPSDRAAAAIFALRGWSNRALLDVAETLANGEIAPEVIAWGEDSLIFMRVGRVEPTPADYDARDVERTRLELLEPRRAAHVAERADALVAELASRECVAWGPALAVRPDADP